MWVYMAVAADGVDQASGRLLVAAEPDAALARARARARAAMMAGRLVRVRGGARPGEYCRARNVPPHWLPGARPRPPLRRPVRLRHGAGFDSDKTSRVAFDRVRTHMSHVLRVLMSLSTLPVDLSCVFLPSPCCSCKRDF